MIYLSNVLPSDVADTSDGLSLKFSDLIEMWTLDLRNCCDPKPPGKYLMIAFIAFRLEEDSNRG